ncbi:MAG TPA: hypothetical protein VF040_08955 [Ktedonobacterales bacterium]
MRYTSIHRWREVEAAALLLLLLERAANYRAMVALTTIALWLQS